MPRPTPDPLPIDAALPDLLAAMAGSGAAVLQASDTPGILATHIHSNGEYEDLLQTRNGVSLGFDASCTPGAYIEMNGNAVFKRAVATFDSMARETVADLLRGEQLLPDLAVGSPTPGAT